MKKPKKKMANTCECTIVGSAWKTYASRSLNMLVPVWGPSYWILLWTEDNDLMLAHVASQLKNAQAVGHNNQSVAAQI